MDESKYTRRKAAVQPELGDTVYEFVDEAGKVVTPEKTADAPAADESRAKALAAKGVAK